MDGRHFDALAKRLSSRRTALGSLLAGLLLPLESVTGKGKDKSRKHKGKGKGKGKGKDRGKGKSHDKKRTRAQAEVCWRSGACILKKGANVSQCNLAGYTAPTGLDCTGCNVSRANLRGANLKGVKFSKANLSGACLVDADFTGATFANNTNLANAIFCNTKMPNGNINDSGCAAGTSCCTTPCLSDAQCNAGQVCCSGTCVTSNQYGLETTFGEFGDGPGQFNLATGVAVSPDGLTAWAADLNNNRISVWERTDANSIDWEYQTTFGSSGSDAGNFREPWAVVASPNTLTVWVAERVNDRISVWTRNDATSLAWEPHSLIGAGQINGPVAVAVTPNGLTAFAAESEADRITVWSRESADSTEWSHHSSFGSSGSGADKFESPSGVAVSPDGLTVWVGDTNNRRVSIWRRNDSDDTEWEPWTTFGNGGSGPTQINLPRGLAISPDTLKIWVCDSANERMSVWTRPDASSTGWTRPNHLWPGHDGHPDPRGRDS